LCSQCRIFPFEAEAKRWCETNGLSLASKKSWKLVQFTLSEIFLLLQYFFFLGEQWWQKLLYKKQKNSILYRKNNYDTSLHLKKETNKLFHKKVKDTFIDCE
jgi:hypothetical protein